MYYMTDYIGEEYKEWKNEDCIFLSASTGSGKTFFILRILLPFLNKENKRILYLVNRTILKEQIEVELNNLSYDEHVKSIKIMTYQTIEKLICDCEDDENKNDNYYGLRKVKKFTEYDCVVCDECHYFLTDSNYNTNTALSFRFIQENYFGKIRIFISSTINDIEDFIRKDNKKRFNHNGTFFYQLTPYPDYGNEKEMIEYRIPSERKYEYIEPHILQSHTDIIDMVNEEEGKWLIFVDSIDVGRELKRELQKEQDRWEAEKESERIKEKFKKRFKKELPENAMERLEKVSSEIAAEHMLKYEKKNNKIVMLSSDYRHHKDGEEEVTEIKQEERQSARILISTSVMDNGISLKDIELRNIILSADNEVEFIQMLGRKRMDGKQLKLYIYKLDKNHFIRRKRFVQKALEVAREYQQRFEEPLRIYPNSAVQHYYFSKIDWNELNEKEHKILKKQNIRLMRDIANQRVKFDYLSKIFNVYCGTLYLNLLAFSNLENLNTYYQRIIDKFDKEGEDAFVREQLHWLDKDAEADKIIEDSKMSRFEKARNRVIEKMMNLVDSEMSIKELTSYTDEMHDDLLIVLEYVDKNDSNYLKTREAIYKKGTPLSKYSMDFLREKCDIPFILVTENKKRILKHVQDDKDINNKK